MPVTVPRQTDQALLQKVRAAFTAKGTSLHRWCLDQGHDQSFVWRSLTGERTSPAALKLRKRALRAAGIRVTEAA